MFNIVYSKKVKKDFIIINDYISLDNPIYWLKTINSIIHTIDILKTFPYIGKEVDWNLREIVENRYKYKIVYIINWKIINILSVYKYKNDWK
jgi:plasmid stabilization system protein ParE